MEKDKTKEQLMQCALDDLDTVRRSLTRHLEISKRPTQAQMRAMRESVWNAVRFIKAARQ